MLKKQLVEIEVLFRYGLIKKRPVELTAFLLWDRINNPTDDSLDREILVKAQSFYSRGLAYGKIEHGKIRQVLTEKGKAFLKIGGERLDRRGKEEERRGK